MEHLAEPVLLKSLKNQPSLETRRRVQQLLDQLAIPAGAQLRQLRPVEVLERLGTTNARQVLQKLASAGSGARLTREAKATMDRLAKSARK